MSITMELDMARSLCGKIKPEVRARLQAFYDNPSTEGWDDVAGIIVTGGCGWVTVWQAWSAIDPTAPRAGRITNSRGRILRQWRKIPTRQQFAAALRYATH